MNPAKPSETMFRVLFPALLAVALGQAGCGPGESASPPEPTPEPQPAPKVETRTLHELAASDDSNALRQALQLGQAIDAPNALGQTPLHVAAIKNKPANIEALLAFRANLHAKTQKEKVDALYLACNHGSLDAITPRVTGGGKTDSTAPNGWTAVHVAAIHGRDTVLQLLHDLGKNLSPLCPDGTPLDFARIHKRDSTVQLLTRLGAKKGATFSVHLAARHGDIEALDDWLKRNRSNVHFRMKKHRATPLHWAAGAGKVNTMELLIALGADVDALSNSHTTPLHQAVLHNRPEAAALLIRNNADLNSQNKSGHTPLAYATANRWEDLIRLLQTAGALSGKTL